MTQNTLTPPLSPVRTVPTLDSLNASQRAAILSIPRHDSEQAVPPSIEASRSAQCFLDPQRYALEQQQVFQRLPVPVAVSALLPEAGSVVAVDSYGIDMLLTRDRQGVVRAFLNACTHKGAMLVEDAAPKRAGRLTCPYHAWSFGLDGQLLAVPREETFVGLCKDKRPLAQLACHEAGGLIWVGLDRQRDYDFSQIDAQLVADFESLNLPRLHLYGRKIFDLKANWKLVLEPFLEAYHVRRLHARSVGPLFADVTSVFHHLGRNLRQVSGKVNFDPDDVVASDDNIHKSVTFAYQVFPNLVVVTSPYYISVMILAPRGVDRTVVDYVMLTREPADNPKAEELFAKSYEMIIGVFGGEDFRAAEISHRGLAAGAIPDLVYCGLEEMIPRYYETLDRELAIDKP